MSWAGRRVAIVGAAATPVGRFSPKSGPPAPRSEADTLAAIARAAMKAAGVMPQDIGTAAFTAPGAHVRQQGFAAFMAARLGLRCRGFLGEVAAMGLTGGLAFEQAINSIALGECDFALALGIVSDTGVPLQSMQEEDLFVTGDADFQAPFGFSPISWYALDAARYMHETRASRADLAMVAVKSRQYAESNPLAQFRTPMTLETVLAQPMIVEPLGRFEVPAVADGAACIVLASIDAARALGQPFVTVCTRALGHDGNHQMSSRPNDMIAFPAAAIAARTAFQEAGLTPADIHVAELYAPCTISEVLACEAIGFSRRGQGAADAVSGATSSGGRISVNTSGGCLSRGHPAPVTALYGLIEVYEQLLERSGDRQVGGASLGMHACELGNYNAALIHILKGPQ